MNQDEIIMLSNHLRGMKGREEAMHRELGDLMAKVAVMESERISAELLFDRMIDGNKP
jgi:hypothetical protein